MTGEKRALKALLEEKQALDLLEGKAARIHLDRLRQGSLEGIETSALEIDTLHDLRQINDHLVSIAQSIWLTKDKKQKTGPKGIDKAPAPPVDMPGLAGLQR